MTKKTKLLSLCLSMLLNTTSAYTKTAQDHKDFGQLVDRIIATVGGDVILYSQIVEKIQSGYPVQFSSHPAPSNSSEFILALQDQVNIQLVISASTKLGIEVSDSDVQTQIDKMLSSQNMTRASLKEYLNKEKKTYSSYLTMMKTQMILMNFKKRMVAPFIKITDVEMQNYYYRKLISSKESMKDTLLTLESIKIEIPTEAPSVIKKAKEKLAQEAYKKLKAGESIAEVANLYSNGKISAPIEYRVSDLQTELKKASKGLKIGEYTTPIKLADGFYIFKLKSQKTSKNSNYLKKKEEIEAALREQKAKTIITNWVTNARQQKKPHIIAQ